MFLYVSVWSQLGSHAGTAGSEGVNAAQFDIVIRKENICTEQLHPVVYMSNGRVPMNAFSTDTP